MTAAMWRSAWLVSALAGLSSCESMDFDSFAPTNIRPLLIEEVPEVAAAINNAEISAGHTVETRLINAKVRGLAQQFVDAHTSANVRLGQLARKKESEFASPIALGIRDQSRAANKRLAVAVRGQLDIVYLIEEIKTQTQALALINCVLVPPTHHDALGMLIEQIQETINGQLRDLLAVRRELALPDNGEARVIGCSAMCTQPEQGNGAGEPSLSEGLRAAICL